MKQTKRVWFCLWLSLAATTAQAESSPTAPPATAASNTPPQTAPVEKKPLETPHSPPHTITNNKLEQQLANSLNDGSRIEWWGPESATYLALWRDQTTRQHHGTLVLLHSQGQNPDWPGVIHDLRSEFPAQGWSTVSISLPLLTTPILPKDKEATGNNAAENTPPIKPPDQPATEPTATQTAAPVVTKSAEETSLPIQLTGAERIADTLTHLGSQPGAKVLIAYQFAAESLLRAVRDGKITGYSAVVIIEPRFSTPAPSDLKQLTEELALLNKALLDVSAERGDAISTHYRKAAAKRAKRVGYQQWIAPGATADFVGTTALLQHQLRGWLHREFEIPAQEYLRRKEP